MSERNESAAPHEPGQVRPVSGDHHVVLVQIVTQEETLARISNELLEILRRSGYRSMSLVVLCT